MSPGLYLFMSLTFFDSGPSQFSGDLIRLTRIAGGRGRALIMSFAKAGASYDARMAHDSITLTVDEVKAVRDNLTRFLDGVKDGAVCGTFEWPMTTREYQALSRPARRKLWGIF